MKFKFKYFIIFTTFILFNLFEASCSSPAFRENFNQEEGLKLLRNFKHTFEEFEKSLIEFTNTKPCPEKLKKYADEFPREDIWNDQFKAYPVLKNIIEVAINYADATLKTEVNWHQKDDGIHLRMIQKLIWEQRKIYDLPRLLRLFYAPGSFLSQIRYNLEGEAAAKKASNIIEFMSIMSQKGDKEDKENVEIYNKYKKLEEKKREEFKSNNSQGSLYDDPDYKRYASKQAELLKSLEESASVSDIPNLPILDYKKLYENLLYTKISPIYHYEALVELGNQIRGFYYK